MIPWTVALQAPPSIGFSRRGDWSGLPFPSLEDLPNPGIEPRSPALQADALTWSSQMVQMVKNPPAMQETRVQSLDRKDPLEKEMATHSSILVWEVPRTEEPSGLQNMGSQKNWM